MKFFKNRTVALILCVVIVLGSTLLNTRIKLGSRCRDLDEEFYATGGIAYLLETVHVEADTLAAQAEAKGIDASGLRSASEDLQRVLSQRSLSAAQLYPYYDALRSEISTAASQLGDSGAAGETLARIESAQNAISASDYNAHVRRFCSRYDNFISKSLAALAGVDLPEEFA